MALLWKDLAYKIESVKLRQRKFYEMDPRFQKASVFESGWSIHLSDDVAKLLTDINDTTKLECLSLAALSSLV